MSDYYDNDEYHDAHAEPTAETPAEILSEALDLIHEATEDITPSYIEGRLQEILDGYLPGQGGGQPPSAEPAEAATPKQGCELAHADERPDISAAAIRVSDFRIFPSVEMRTHHGVRWGKPDKELIMSEALEAITMSWHTTKARVEAEQIRAQAVRDAEVEAEQIRAQAVRDAEVEAEQIRAQAVRDAEV
ncbi:hypothetical protein, partial [Nonomuraea sp. NPDC050540]|uniref:hypothetical protein n=1 Tax=Nonomuraea sp. NPDC050540 TaxID=3364367 RepID=UPI0037B9874A